MAKTRKQVEVTVYSVPLVPGGGGKQEQHTVQRVFWEEDHDMAEVVEQMIERLTENAVARGRTITGIETKMIGGVLGA